MKTATQKESILELFKLYDGKVTLGQIMKTPLAAEYRARFSEMRKEGYSIICKKGDVPSENTYTLETHSKPSGGTLPSNNKLHFKADNLDCTSIGVRNNGIIDQMRVKVWKAGAGIYQADYPCPKCGSYYRINKKCNMCGLEVKDVVPVWWRDNL